MRPSLLLAAAVTSGQSRQPPPYMPRPSRRKGGGGNTAAAAAAAAVAPTSSTLTPYDHVYEVFRPHLSVARNAGLVGRHVFVDDIAVDEALQGSRLYPSYLTRADDVSCSCVLHPTRSRYA